MPRRSRREPAPLWWLGVHGGAGETTLERLSDDARAAEHAWPLATSGHSTVALVVRTHHDGLMRAREAAAEWARGDVPVHLIGLVLIADAPGRRPKPLRELVQLVSGTVPRVWHIPWVEAWRMEPAQARTAPRALHRMLAETAAAATRTAQSPL